MDLSLLVAAAIGMLIMLSLKAVAEFFKMPFKWACPDDGCFFKAASNTMRGLEEVKEHHQRSSHNG